MTDYALWVFGRRVPEFQVFRGHKSHDEHTRLRKLSEPVALAYADAELPLDVLAKLYPLVKGDK